MSFVFGFVLAFCIRSGVHDVKLEGDEIIETCMGHSAQIVPIYSYNHSAAVAMNDGTCVFEVLVLVCCRESTWNLEESSAGPTQGSYASSDKSLSILQELLGSTPSIRLIIDDILIVFSITWNGDIGIPTGTNRRYTYMQRS
jgi:hypothetical protein